jgi:MYXO-CTERM domain-containing protein
VEEVGTSAAAITASDAIARAEAWVTAKLLYCQSPNGASDTIDPSCPAVCMRQSNPAWDPYRSDCSGLVSWAWGLPAPGRTTAELAPNMTDITKVIDASTLAMGDAVCTDDATSNDHHVMLFKAWTVPGQEATFIEEPGCSATPDYAHEFTSAVTLSGTSITVKYNGMTFSAIRYGALTASAASSSSSSSTGSGSASSTTATGTGGSGGSSSGGGGAGGAGTDMGPGANGGCQVSTEGMPSLTGLGLLAGLLAAGGRARRRPRPSASSRRASACRA